jgi:hypothetical protein
VDDSEDDRRDSAGSPETGDARSPVPDITLEESEAAMSVDAESQGRALALLARWAVRRREKLSKGRPHHAEIS